VALKRLQGKLLHREDLQRRFLREATIQGNLEHPAIVPVYDLGTDEAGRSFFTMRRVWGKTLDHVLEGLRQGDADLEGEFSRHRLLAIFVTVCQAVEYAHEQGIIHRDLKPANIMLGAFGEVYILDWGIAKVLEEPDGVVRGEALLDANTSGSSPRTSDTKGGVILGTEGYMAPEQHTKYLGAPSVVSDVYALGKILYELVTLRTVGTATLSSPESHDRPDRTSGEHVHRGRIPPELEALWVKATKRHPQERIGSVRELREGVERYAAGDRNLSKRKEMSLRHTQAALRDAEGLLGSEESALSARRRCLRELATALSFDPSNQQASQLLFEVMTQPPRGVPPELVEERARRHDRRIRSRLREVSRVLGGVVFFVPASMAAGIREPLWFAWDMAMWLCAGVSAAAMARREKPVGVWLLVPVLFLYLGVLGGMLALGIFAPFVMVLFLLPAGLHLEMVRHDVAHRRGAAALAFAFLTGIISLQAMGVFTTPATFLGEEIRIRPRMIAFDARWGLPMLGIGTLIGFALFIGRVWNSQQRLVETEDEAALAHWQWKQLVPTFQPQELLAGTADDLEPPSPPSPPETTAESGPP
jgi:serine/threonine-protein kinase